MPRYRRSTVAPHAAGAAGIVAQDDRSDCGATGINAISSSTAANYAGLELRAAP
jgi:hypothetical protein